MRVLLVANYEPDGQESMLRFAALLERGLREGAAEPGEVAVVRPPAVLGRLAGGWRGIGKWFGYCDKFVLFPPVLRRLARPFDLVHLCDHSNAPYLGVLRGRPTVVTCHDLLAVRAARGEFPGIRVRWSGRGLQRLILRGLRGATRIACDSLATRADVGRLLGRREADVPVVYPGINPAYFPEPGRSPVGGRYLLHVAGGQWYKNREGLLAIYAAVRERLGAAAPALVIVGPPPAAGLAGVQVMAGVDDVMLRRLYSDAELLLLPSLAEGYGWPVVEAQACGCRVAATGRAPLTEIGGAAAVYFPDPRDAAGGAAAVLGLLAEDAAARRARVEAGVRNAGRFGVDNMVAGYLAVYRELPAAGRR